MATERQATIAELMNALGDRKFTPFEIATIEAHKVPEYEDRKNKNIQINGKTEEGKKQINKRLAAMVNEVIKPKIPITAEDIRRYKRCWADEYTNRTGKCAWGFKEVRAKLGYDPVTGVEVEEI